MKEIRVHARAGQGAITVANLLGDAAFREKKYAVAFPTFGAARMGAPMNAFIRIDAKPIRARSQIHHPDYIIVMDPTLLQGFNVFEGLKEGGVALISADPEKIKPEGAPAGSKVRLQARFVEMLEQPGPRVWHCPRAAAPVAVDGVLEDAWEAAEPLDMGRYEGPAAFEPTTVRALYDDTHLYLCFDARESDMGNFEQKTQTKDDVYNANDVEIFLRNTARKDQQFQFIANTDGVKWDGNSTQGKQWEPKWLRQGKRGKDGYVIEVAIPWAELDKADPNKKILKNQPKSHDRLWRINLCRNDHTAGAAVPSRSSLDGRWGASESAVRLFLGTPQEYIDLSARLTNAKATEAQYRALLDRAVNVEEILSIYDSLGRVRSEIDQLEGRITYLERTAAMSLISVRLEPSGSPQGIVKVGWSLVEVAKSALRGIVIFGQGLANVLVWALVFSPVWGGVTVLVWWLLRRRRKGTSAG